MPDPSWPQPLCVGHARALTTVPALPASADALTTAAHTSQGDVCDGGPDKGGDGLSQPCLPHLFLRLASSVS